MPSQNPRGRQAVEISSAFTALAFFTVALRLYARFFLVRCAGLEDYGIVLAMICSIGLTIAIGFQAEYGMGQHLKDLQPETVQMSLQAFFSSLIVYYLSLGLTKASILLQYQRVFTTKRFQLSCWSLMGVVIIYALWTVFGSIFACVPVRAFWTREPGAKCIDQFSMWFTNAAMNIVTDFAIIILPIPVIQSLNLGRRQKVALISIFAVGGFVCIVSILRLHSLVAISNSVDPTYDNPPAATWSSVEINVGIICSCLPLLRPILTRFMPGAMSSKTRSKNAGPRQYATIRSTRSRKATTLTDDDSLEMTKQSHDVAEREIQVVTDISVQVEGVSSGTSVWSSPATKPEWVEQENTKKQGSTDTLVKDVGQMDIAKAY
ncbi:hypothetical protein HBI56_101940 [Parastagonospora nodorum]|uniref:Rhodopsin domain-containing protein n=1 Tax=Phaeosphaeria nodorum (strain SN15 / ATCC MYA-4574 / FGSC 10173) TaxID=321614 RepID=A0A7U2F7Y5_PHANO|nr:hypothetical protein HBH56_030900 [Parastagonospora nodorum]QRC99318.1 hypothetical protein JI435_066480 [Parastagonospora nodorum SN15]KAH3934462.1 hypothetical protein HBH54_051110 [Parastagonospora nodorum]KAH3942996.1 hypothetical protein HBH53_179560 [Parastagonospora nodorum]KAH3956639.1 hypothetical protein HBH51_238460 [Parastagonospora nodorum]